LLNWAINPSPADCQFRGVIGASKTDMNGTVLAALLLSLLIPFGAAAAEYDDLEQQQPKGESSVILNKYVQATQGHEGDLRGASMDVDIDASVPKLKEHGKLRALRKISKVGQITYRVLGFQGDNTKKPGHCTVSSGGAARAGRYEPCRCSGELQIQIQG
jgi:hypothetical protein